MGNYKKKANGKNDTGRPTKYKPEYCQLLIKHMTTGLSYETFGAALNVSKETIYDWERAHAEFLDSKRIAFTKCQEFWEKLGIDEILNTSEYQGGSKSLNSAVWVFNMKNRFNWKDKTEHTGENGGALQIVISQADNKL
jgi:hypothetical protein